MASSSSSSSVQQKYQVFLSFRGEDTRNNFTSHLHAALKQKGIDTFIDYQLNKGGGLSPSLLTAIEESKISVIVLSKNYASSSWCLIELSKIVECKERNGQKIIPIFYHVDPSHVRNQEGSFAAAFAKHQERFKDRKDEVESWKAALKEVANLIGWHLQGQLNDRPESAFIEDIVEDISKQLMFNSLYGTEHLVGIDKRIKQIERLLCIDSVDVRIIGIWGMGGIGKTTIAEAVYTRFSTGFEGCCFVNVREELKHGPARLREELFFKILKDRNLNVGTSLLPDIVIERLQCKKVFIVFDDVDNSMQLDLLPKKNYLRPGSRIIVTSRDKQVFEQEVDEMYPVEELIEDEAIQLFSSYAFKRGYPEEDVTEVLKKVVHYAKGVPLALRVLGSTLSGKRRVSDWEVELNKLKEMPNLQIDNILRISYDGLDQKAKEKDIFLDIACFFKGKDRDYVTNILDCCYTFVMSKINVLIEKSLITISQNMLEMHDLLQQMAWNIVRQESEEPGKRSRLWTNEDIYHVLDNDTGTETVKGLFLDMSEFTKICRLSPTAFARMHNLKMLKFYYSDSKRDGKVYLSQQGLESLPNNLRYFHWDEYPSKSLPSNFRPKNLVELNMRNSHVKQLWNGVQNLMTLKRLNLSGSQHLIKIPDLTQAINLERMELDGCTSLVEVPSSIGFLNKLSYLSLQRCQNLGNFPSSVHLRSLTTLFLTDCPNVTKFPEISGILETLYLSGTAIEEVPLLIECLFRLKKLNLGYCTRVRRLPNNICKLKCLEYLNLNGCLKLESFPEISETMEHLRWLSLGDTSIEELHSSIEHLVGLVDLGLENCGELKNLPSSIEKLESLKNLCLRNCSNITRFPEIPRNLESLNLSGTAIEQVPPSIENHSRLQFLYLKNCTKLGRLPSDLFMSNSHGGLKVFGFSKLERVQEHLGAVEVVNLQ